MEHEFYRIALVATEPFRGELAALSGDQLLAAQKHSADITHRIALAYQAEIIVPRLLEDSEGTFFRVLYVEQDPQQRFTNLYVKAVAHPMEDDCL